jgi:hypothetical protein
LESANVFGTGGNRENGGRVIKSSVFSVASCSILRCDVLDARFGLEVPKNRGARGFLIIGKWQLGDQLSQVV